MTVTSLPDAPDVVFSLAVSPEYECGRRWLSAHVDDDVYVTAGRFSTPYCDVSTGFHLNSAPIYRPYPTLNRDEPSLRFMGVEGTSFNVNVHLVAEDEQYSIRALRGAVQWLTDLNQPTTTTDGRGRYAPPPLIVNIGGVFRTLAVAEGVVVHWGGSWSVSSPGENGPVPLMVTVSLAFHAIPQFFANFDDILPSGRNTGLIGALGS